MENKYHISELGKPDGAEYTAPGPLAALRQYLKQHTNGALSIWDYTVSSAADGEICVRELDRFHPDLRKDFWFRCL